MRILYWSLLAYALVGDHCKGTPSAGGEGLNVGPANLDCVRSVLSIIIVVQLI